MMSANSPSLKRISVVMTVLAVGLILGTLVISSPPAETQSASTTTEKEDGLIAPTREGASFDFLDHELRYAGDYALIFLPRRPGGFDFLDHEMKYAGGYGLVTGPRRAEGFDFLDHELRYAGGYRLAHRANMDSTHADQ